MEPRTRRDDRFSARTTADWAFSNHDVPRVASRWGGGATGAFALRVRADARSAVAGATSVTWLALLLALRGTTFLYQSEEPGYVAELQAAGIPHQYAEHEGGHGWADWGRHLEDTLRFFARTIATGTPAP